MLTFERVTQPWKVIVNVEFAKSSKKLIAAGFSAGGLARGNAPEKEEQTLKKAIEVTVSMQKWSGVTS